MDFPGNSHAAKVVSDDPPDPAKSEKANEPKKIERVVTGKERKKTIGGKAKDLFFNDGVSFGEYLIEKVIVPMAKDMILSIITQTADGVRGGIEQKLFGPDEAGRRNRTANYRNGNSVVNYTRYSNVPSSSRRDEITRPPSRAVRRSNVIKEIILDDREHGDLVLAELDATIERYGHCTVGDFYSLVDVATVNTDEEWGWEDLREASVRRVGDDEFLMVMPRPRPIRT